jgi:hypothetical protein
MLFLLFILLGYWSILKKRKKNPVEEQSIYSDPDILLQNNPGDSQLDPFPTGEIKSPWIKVILILLAIAICLLPLSQFL